MNRIALLGQPNSGKSTVFNQLTGYRQHVGNWPGKTVEKNDGTYSYKDAKYTLIDLPGSYGLSGNSDEEIITYKESHSFAWTAKTASFYVGASLVLSCIVYHVSSLFLG